MSKPEAVLWGVDGWRLFCGDDGVGGDDGGGDGDYLVVIAIMVVIVGL